MSQTSAGGRPIIRVFVLQNSAVVSRVAATHVEVVKLDGDIAKIYVSAWN